METQTYACGASDGSTDQHRRDQRDDPQIDLRSAEAIQQWLLAQLAERLGIAPHDIDIREPFDSYGLSSREAVTLSGELEDWLGVRLSATLMYEYPTVEALARYLAAPAPSVVGRPLQRDTDDQEMTEDGARTTHEPIAIIGIGCRFPGAKDPQAFWRLLRDGVDAITDVPPDRWDVQTVYDPDPEAPGKTNTRWGGFLEQVDQFDPFFFGISPREAARQDPQQRLLLEVAWEALEDAGQVPERLAGTRTGVFVGISTNEYSRLQLGSPELIDAYAGTGNALCIAANRISYLFDFQGPSMAVDTACSSSLVAVHLACRSLWNGEATMALAGGVSLILSPAITINFTKAGVMAPDGRCKTFDARANGYVRGEGAGMVVLKPLAQALADGDPIYAVIRGSAVGHDGRTNGLMAPSPLAQAAVLREAYRRAAVAPGQVQYVEAHGTGTLLGDPIEAKALGAVLGADRGAGQPCVVGSAKTNIGHLEAAAGVAGLIKVALSLKHRAIPPSLHFHEPNPHIPFEELSLRVAQTLSPWPDETRPLLAGVSSFGFGGTNAHVVLEEAPGAAHRVDQAPAAEQPHLLTLSAHTQEALRALASAYQDVLRPDGSQPVVSLHDICYTASARRTHHGERLAVVGRSHEELCQRLGAWLSERADPNVSSGHKAPNVRRKIAFVFPGQGSQWVGMGRDLLEQEPVFRATLEECDRVMRQYVDWSLLEELTADKGRAHLDEIDIVQPLVFAVEVALAALWRSWGVEPDAVVGHSMGEVAAACVAGALSLDEAARVICRRSQLMKRVSGQGAMAALGLSEAQAQELLSGYEDRLSIAVSNSPTATVLSGDPAALEEIVDRVRRQNIFCRRVKVDVAAHSMHMDALRPELIDCLEALRPQTAAVPIYSTVTAEPIDGRELDAAYWGRNLRQPVLFAAAVQRLLADGYNIFLEISPHPTLITALQHGLHYAGREGAALPSLQRAEAALDSLLTALGALYTLGYPLDWGRRYPSGGQCVPLSTDPWQGQRYWLDSASGGARRGAGAGTALSDAQRPALHPLLGSRLPAALREVLFESCLGCDSPTFLNDHRVYGMAVLPGTAYLELALAAANEAFGAGAKALEEVVFQEALIFPEDEHRSIQVVLSPESAGRSSFQIFSRGYGEDDDTNLWILHARGAIRIGPSELPPPQQESLSPVWLQSHFREQVSGTEHYQRYLDCGMQYGSAFQGVQKIWRRDGEALGLIQLPEGLVATAGAYQVHPALLDASFQVVEACLASEDMRSDAATAYMPIAIDRFRLYRTPDTRVWSDVVLRGEQAPNQETLTADVRLYDETGHVVADVVGLHLKRARRDALVRATQKRLRDCLYELAWQPAARRPQARPTAAQQEVWLIFADQGGVGAALARLLAERGQAAVIVVPGREYEPANNGYYRIDPARPEDVRRLLDDVSRTCPAPCRRIIHLWGLNTIRSEEVTVAALEEAQALGCGSVLQLAQALASSEWPEPPRLWLVTRGTQPAGPRGTINVAQAPMWGLGRVLALEHPELWGGLIDLDPNPTIAADAAARLFEEIWAPDGEDQLAFRAGQRYVARLVPDRRRDAQPLHFRADGVYLITGGLGALGLQSARWMVEHGARHLALIGRTGLPLRAAWDEQPPQSDVGRRIAAIRELEVLGAEVQVYAADVGDPDQMASVFEQMHATGLPLRGVMHAAGVSTFQELRSIDRQTLQSVLRPKVSGAWVIHQLTRDMDLDFFVLFSSAASVWGSKGLAHYAAANHFLDALAYYRQGCGMAALSVNWAQLSEPGMVSSEEQDFLAQIGLDPVPVEQALDMLGSLMGAGVAQRAVAAVDWSIFKPLYQARMQRPLLDQIALSSRVPDEPPLKQSDLARRLEAVPVGQRKDIVLAHIRGEVAQVLDCDPAQLDPQRGLFEMGMDSLMALKIQKRLEAILGRSLPSTLAFDHPTLDALAGYLERELFPAESAPEHALEPPARETVAQASDRDGLEHLSEDELVALLAEELAGS